MSEHVLMDRYELGDRLGIGGMAEVYLGKDRVLGRPVAVKTLLAQFAHDPSFIARFKREATSAAQLNHPNIVGVYDTGADDGRQFIVMEYIEGKTLKDVIREEGPLLPERAAEIAAEVCGALQFAHAHGIVHRDVKPANIMMNTRGEVKVADFGIARAASGETVTQTATVLGTAQYFSPEQAQAAPVDARSDLYSLGVVLYEMLTRQVPFTGASPVAIAYKHVKEDPIPPSRLNADVPASIEAVVMKALAKNPANRYQSAQEMRQDLERAIRGMPISAPAVMTPADQTAVLTAPHGGDETVMLRGGVAHAPVRNRRTTGIALLAAIAIAMVAILIWALVALLPKSSPTTRVPEVSGRPFAEAQQILQRAGFEPRRGPDEQSANVEPGIVLKTDPPEGTALAKGSAVTMTVSAGRPQVEVPDVKGKTREDAEEILKGKGFVVSATFQEDDKVPEGSVISQNPAPKTMAAEGATVTLVVSSGRAEAQIPNVVGMTESAAEQRLRQAGFTPVVERRAAGPNCDASPGVVCRQSPSAGTRAERGSEVVIFVAEQPEPTQPPPPDPTPTDSASPGSNSRSRRR